MGTLYVIGTPIGNLGDMSPRAVQALRDVSLIAAEDTRHSKRLLNHFAISTPLLSYHQHNQRERRARLLAALQEGDIALISDAGTPAVSDPGADLVTAALEAGHQVSPIPGASALTAAVSASGLIDGPFVMLGFLPRDRKSRGGVVARGAATQWPLVIYEAANRLAGTLAELLEALGDRRAIVCRELTKLHEEVRPGTLHTLRGWAAESTPRGEVAIVVDGAAPATAAGDDAAAVVALLRRSGLSASQAAREAAAITGLPRSELYQLATSAGTHASVGLEGELALSNEDALQDALGDQKGPKRRESRTDEG